MPIATSRPSCIVSIDIETRSSLELKKSGAYHYTADQHRCLVCCQCFVEQEIQVWEVGQTVPEAIVLHAEGGTFAAWNAQFEKNVWKHILAPLRMARTRDRTMALYPGEAMAYGLPASLEDAARSLGLDNKRLKRKEPHAPYVRPWSGHFWFCLVG